MQNKLAMLSGNASAHRQQGWLKELTVELETKVGVYWGTPIFSADVETTPTIAFQQTYEQGIWIDGRCIIIGEEVQTKHLIPL